MKRTTIMLPDDVDARLRLEARRRGQSIAQVAREAIERELPAPGDGRLGFFAVGDGSPRTPRSESTSSSLKASGAAAAPGAEIVLIVDAGPLYAAAARRDKHHEQSVRLLS